MYYLFFNFLQKNKLNILCNLLYIYSDLPSVICLTSDFPLFASDLFFVSLDSSVVSFNICFRCALLMVSGGVISADSVYKKSRVKVLFFGLDVK